MDTVTSNLGEGAKVFLFHINGGRNSFNTLILQILKEL